MTVTVFGIEIPLILLVIVF